MNPEEINTNPIQSDSYIPEQKPAPKKSNLAKIVIGLILGAVLLIAIPIMLLIFFVFRATSDVSEAGGTVLQRVVDGQCAGLYEDLASSEFRATTSAARWDGICQTVRGVLPPIDDIDNEGASINKATGLDDMGSARFEFTGTDKRPYKLEIKLIRPGETWQLLNFDLQDQSVGPFNN